MIRLDREFESSGRRPPVVSVFGVAKVRAMQQIAGEFEVHIQVLAGPGERYTLPSGYQGKLADNKACVAIYNNSRDPRTGLTNFYRRADEIVAKRQEQL